MATNITILGSGAMATACALILADHPDQKVTIWGRDPAHIAAMREARENFRLLPGIAIPHGIGLTTDIASALAEADCIVTAIPTQFLRGSLQAMAATWSRSLPVVSVTKGLENGSWARPSQIIQQSVPVTSVAALSGPSHAEEFARGQPAIVVAASVDAEFAQQVQTMFTTQRFRVYTNPDLLGVELAGALKNVIAIAAGISDGLGYGDNAKSSLMTRGLVEITRLGLHFGAEPATFAGLAGMGDLITTCISPYGRNRRVGERLGRGETLEQILASMTAVAEGVATARSVYELSLREGIEMPISTEVYRVLFEGKSPEAATQSLMLRPPRSE